MYGVRLVMASRNSGANAAPGQDFHDMFLEYLLFSLRRYGRAAHLGGRAEKMGEQE
jgi:hypothetical protein